MGTGSLSTFVIAWAQVEIDGFHNTPLSAVTIGATMRWSGTAVCVDGARSVLVLDQAIGNAELHQRAARMVRRLVGTALDGRVAPAGPQDRLFDGGFDVTDGLKKYELTLIDMPQLGAPLVMCLGDVPPEGVDLWVTDCHIAALREAEEACQGGAICFTPQTMIETPQGARAVAELSEGDWVLTKDNGPQKIMWIGGRRISGARLYAMPELRPVRLRADALGVGEPTSDLVVSPHHRMLIGGAAARELFNADEVLVAAQDLVNDRSIVVDRHIREVSYIHLMLESHQVLFANGLETESFHPAFTDLGALDAGQQERLLTVMPELDRGADLYGPAARRTLSSAEAAILLHAAA
ncbi:Hint domain-containing protein [Celeribacter sp.]|uniref:Hint domain-containing protein n=1 Tax=Celeribacter sp. TaxID=1890673 RepID=UPI003A95214C